MMTENEALIRAREAFIAQSSLGDHDRSQVRVGAYDSHAVVVTIFRVLLDTNKPLSEIVPVDPDLIEAREIAAQYWDERGSPWTASDILLGRDDDNNIMKIALACIKRGRALASVQS